MHTRLLVTLLAIIFAAPALSAQFINHLPDDVAGQVKKRADVFSSAANAFFFGPSSQETGPGPDKCTSGQGQAACVGPNTQANNPDEDALFDPTGTRRARFRGQSETTIAISGSNFLGSWNDATGFFVPAKGLSGVGYSRDGGTTWCDGRGFRNPEFPTRTPFGDNVAVVDREGNFFVSYLYNTPEAGLAPVSALGVSRVRFETLPGTCPDPKDPVTQERDNAGLNNVGDDPVIAAISGTDFLDKEWLAIDPNLHPVAGKQAMYICYTRFIGIVSNGQIEVVRSLDGGQTWNGALPPGAPGGPVIVQPDQFITEGQDIVNQGCYVEVGPNHEVYVVWENGWLFNGDADPLGARPNIRFAKSTDFGETFTAPKVIADFFSLARRPPAGYNRTRIDDFPKIGVDRNTSSPKFGSLYVTWQASPAVRSPLADVLVAISRDGGETWQAPIVVNSDKPGKNLHFFPAISVDDFGNVNVIFYDRREDPFTPAPFTESTTGGDPNDSGLTNLYAAQIPVIGGKIANWRITDVKSDWRAARSNIAPNFGDYIHAVSVGDVLHSLWADSRNDNTPSPFYAPSDTKALPAAK